MPQGMVTRCGSHDTEDVPVTKDSPPPDIVSEEHFILEGDSESSEYCEETDTHHPLAELLEQCCQCKNQFASLKSTTQIQQKDTETLAAYIHCFKTAPK